VAARQISISGITPGKSHTCGRDAFNTHNCMGCEAACQVATDGSDILTAEDVVRRIAAECAYVDERVASVFGWSRRPQLCGGTENNSAGRLSADKLGARRSHRLCSDFVREFRPYVLQRITH
jgi:hypothetical protein